MKSSKSYVATEKRSNFEQVAAGVCPHDNCKLGNEIRGSGIGVTRVCAKCGHAWYINKKIHTCKCLTCSGSKRNTTERVITKRIERGVVEKRGGRYCTIGGTFELVFNL